MKTAVKDDLKRHPTSDNLVEPSSATLGEPRAEH